MSWITVTDDMAMASNSPERLMVVKIKRADDLGDLVAEAVETFRGAIRSSGQPLGPDGTIPMELQRYVLDFAIWAFVSRGVARNPVIQDDSRKEANGRAEKILFKIISKELKVTSDDATQTISHGVSVVRRGRKIRTNSFDKLGET
jgi:hypothetical protein